MNRAGDRFVYKLVFWITFVFGLVQTVHADPCQTQLAELLLLNKHHFDTIHAKLVVAKGHVHELEYESARQIAASLQDGKLLLLTPSLFGHNDIPAVDGVIYANNVPETNISIKSIDLTLTNHSDFARKILGIMMTAGESVRNKFNLFTFARTHRAQLREDGHLVVPESELREIELNRVVEFLGLRETPIRKTTVAVTVTHSTGQRVAFRFYEHQGQTFMTVWGWQSKSEINLTKVVQSLKNDPYVAGYILVSSYETVFIDSTGFRTTAYTVH